MKINNNIRFVVINKQASSLYSLIADGHYRATHLGRGNWMSLVEPTAYLQPHCNQEGFDAVPSTWRRVRIGLIANNENQCNSCDSFIGFGYNMLNNTCGNYMLIIPAATTTVIWIPEEWGIFWCSKGCPDCGISLQSPTELCNQTRLNIRLGFAIEWR